jgi:alkanesulfonate monooxygenase SsuD/methylene tetrahydromethanopterin reductase-like flavin-dependent oxidoreductase (luciferase family)
MFSAPFGTLSSLLRTPTDLQDQIFFADSYSLFDIYQSSTAPILRSGAHTGVLDPMVLIPAMASVTSSVGFGVTGSTSYLSPYTLARTFSSLDHLTEGRVAWNVVTSWSKSAALALGKDDVVPHDQRYEVAHEYMDLVYKFWESSWGDDAKVWDRENRIAYEPSLVKKIDHKGKLSQLMLAD